MLARRKLNSKQSKIFEALKIVNLVMKTLIIVNETKYNEVKESIRMMNSQRSDSEKINLIEEGKKIGIDETQLNTMLLNTMKVLIKV